MKVVHILNELKFSGAEIMYVDAAEKFKNLGCELYVINSNAILGEYAPYFEKAGYQVVHMPYPKSLKGRFKFYKNLIKFIKENKIDVVHDHYAGLKWGASFCAWMAGVKSVYTFHNAFPIRWFSKPYQMWLRWSAKHIFKCKFQTISDDVYENELNTFHNRTTLIYNWYGNNRFWPAEKTEKIRIRQELNIDLDALVLISVGGCSEIKRHHEIIKSLPKILEKFPNTIYLHLGNGATLENEVKLAEDLGVKSHIRFEGNQSDVRRYLIASDIYLMPSRFEGIPITTIEALACKIPAILYDVKGLKNFRGNAVIIPENHISIAENVTKLYQDKTLIEELQNKGKAFVDTKFNLDKNVSRIFQLYK